VKRATALAAVAVAGALIVTAFLLRPGTSVPAAPSRESTLPPAQHAGFPVPPPGAVVFSRELGGDALALGVVPKHGSLLLQASVVGPAGLGVSGLSVGFTVQGHATQALACGAGCYHATLPATASPTNVRVDVSGNAAAHWLVALPAVWPPPDAKTLLGRAGKAWRSLQSLSYKESLGSDAHHRIVSAWQMQAPDRLAYQVKGGWEAIVVGTRRWDRPPNHARWQESAQSRLTQPIPFWQAVADAHVLGGTTTHGHSVWLVSFFDPVTPAWFEVALDRRTLRTVDLRMTTTAHFMHDVYGGFNTSPAITPPR
jgi:hypothetical protein